MRELTQKELDEILRKHTLWLQDKKRGIRADLSYTDLSGLNLAGDNLTNANCTGARFNGANCTDACFHTKNGLETVTYDERTAFFALQCPEKGAYTAFKKANGLIVELLIPEDSKRSSATSRKCRASKAYVVSITDIDGNTASDWAASDNDPSFIYRVGETVEVLNFEEDRWAECATGIHHFLTRQEAVQYRLV